MRTDRTTFQVAVVDHIPPATMAELRRDLERGDEMTWQPVGVTGTGLNRRHGTRQGRREGNCGVGERDDTAEWQVLRGSRADPKGPAQRTTPRGNRRVTFASDPSTRTSAQRGGPAKDASTEGVTFWGGPRPMRHLQTVMTTKR